MVLQWPNDVHIRRMYHRVDRSERTLTQVAALILEDNSELAEFQPNKAVVATLVIGSSEVSCYHCS